MGEDSAPALSAEAIASHSLGSTPNQVPQTAHRIDLLRGFDPTIAAADNASSPILSPSSRVLEIGCGQGDTTAILASLAPKGHIDAVDPAPKSYGAPFTLGQAQDHLSKSYPNITWHQATPESFLSSTTETWDAALLVHSTWYLPSPSALLSILESLVGRTPTLCIAEYSLRASETSAHPHVLAAMTRGAWNLNGRPNQANIRCPLSPKAIVDVAVKAGWKLLREEVVVPAQELQDGRWEVGDLISGFEKEVASAGGGEAADAVAAVALAGIEATRAAVDVIGGLSNVRTMDVWTGVFVTG